MNITSGYLTLDPTLRVWTDETANPTQKLHFYTKKAQYTFDAVQDYETPLTTTQIYDLVKSEFKTLQTDLLERLLHRNRIPILYKYTNRHCTDISVNIPQYQLTNYPLYTFLTKKAEYKNYFEKIYQFPETQLYKSFSSLIIRVIEESTYIEDAYSLVSLIIDFLRDLNLFIGDPIYNLIYSVFDAFRFRLQRTSTSIPAEVLQKMQALTNEYKLLDSHYVLIIRCVLLTENWFEWKSFIRSIICYVDQSNIKKFSSIEKRRLSEIDMFRVL